MGLVCKDGGWRLPDWLWERVAPLLPASPAHPLGCHRPRVPDRDALDAILLVLRTEMYVERDQGDGDLLQFFGAPAFSGVGAGRCVRRDLAARAARL